MPKHEWIALQRTTRDSDMRWTIHAVLGVCPRGSVQRMSLTGGGLSGGPTEIDNIIVHEVRDDRFLRIDRFPGDALDAAMRRFDEVRSVT